LLIKIPGCFQNGQSADKHAAPVLQTLANLPDLLFDRLKTYIEETNAQRPRGPLGIHSFTSFGGVPADVIAGELEKIAQDPKNYTLSKV
jgi:hypothetical protein